MHLLTPSVNTQLLGQSDQTTASNSRPKTSPQTAAVDSVRLRLLDSWRIVACSTACFILNMLALVLNITLVRNRKFHVFPPAIIGMFAAALGLASVAFDVFAHEKKKTPASRFFLFSTPSRTAIRQMICFLAFVPVIVALVVLTLEAVDSKGKFDAFINLPKNPKGSVIFVDFLALISDVFLCATMARLVWWPVHRAARSSLLLSSLLQCTIATILIAVNWRPYVGCILRPTTFATITFTLHQHVGALLFTTAMFSFGICCTIKEGDRINKVFTRFIIFYSILASFTVFMLLVILFLSVRLLLDTSLKSLVANATLTCDPFLTSCALILFGVNFWASHYLQEPPPSSLAVEEIDLNDYSQVQKDAFAKLINKYGKNLPDAPDGEAAISLMQAYCNANLPGMKCTVLRVYKPSKIPNKSTILNSMAANYTYEDDWAWRNLDFEQMAIRHRSVLVPEIKEPEGAVTATAAAAQPPPPKLSKKQQKKLAKAKAEAETSQSGPTVPLSPIRTPEELQAEIEFAQKLESTEALIMLSQIPDYDLTGTVKGGFGRLLRYTLGANSYFKPLCVTLGLLAFHWPFRQAIFYTAPAKRPVARTAAVSRAVAEWNDKRPRSERCAVLLDPTYQHGDGERAIVPSGWLPNPLPPSHVIDLRPHKNKTLSEYLKAIKYRDQEAAFKKANGEVLESVEFTDEQCAEVMRLWRKIADKRTGEGQTAVLAEPDEHMLMELGAGGNGDRSLLFLRAGGKTIASCVLFRLGNTITSDMQGLDYELARPLKAYFVMMQHVIGIALKEGKSFVDFGPTTPKPKLDIGCTSVGITGAMYAVNPLLRLAIGVAASKVTGSMETGEKREEKEE